MMYGKFLFALLLSGMVFMSGLTNVCYAAKDEKVMKKIAININKADVEEFEAIKGIGKGLATRIVEYRQINGSFKSKEELMQVDGIGERRYDKIKDTITL